MVLRIKVEFTVEPFVEGGPGPHVRAALDQVRARGLNVDVGPFGNEVDGEHHVVLKTIEPLITAALANGATSVTLGVTRARELTTRDTAFLDAMKPLLGATGATYVEPEDMLATDSPIHWQGELVGAIRAPFAGKRKSVGQATEVADLVAQVENELGGELQSLSRSKKQVAARLLEERGAFRLRGAVDEVADAMGVSRPTVYNYLNAIRRRK